MGILEDFEMEPERHQTTVQSVGMWGLNPEVRDDRLSPIWSSLSSVGFGQMSSSGIKGMDELSASLPVQLSPLICPMLLGEPLAQVTGLALITLKLDRMKWCEVKNGRVCSESGPLSRR